MYLQLYWSNVLDFWQTSFNAEQPLSVFTLLRWLVEFIFFIPSLMILPIAWTIRDSFSKHNPSTQESNLTEVQENVSRIWQVLHDDNPFELYSNIFNTINHILKSEFNGGYMDYHLSINTICKSYLLIYLDGYFYFVPKSHPSISSLTLHDGIKNLFIVAKNIELNHGCPLSQVVKLYTYLVKPFGDEACYFLNNMNADSLHIDAIRHSQGQFRDWIFPKIHGFNRPNFNETDAAIVIQRAYRRHQFMKSKPTRVFPIQYSHDESEQYNQFLIRLDEPTPQRPQQLDKLALEKWVSIHSEDLKPVASGFAKQITHRSWAKTERRLSICISEFNHTIMSYPATDREYAIIVPDTRARKSNHFMTSIAMKYLVHKPFNIISIVDIKSFLLAHPNAKHFLYIDDACYSGKQVKEFLYYYRSQLKARKVSLHLAIPFINLDVKRYLNRYYPDVFIHRHESMLSMKTLTNLGFFSEAQFATIQRVYEKDSYSSGISDRTLYFFDHTIADDVSTFPNIFRYGETFQVHLYNERPLVISNQFSYKS